MTLSSPIESVVGSPLYASAGVSSPTVANWKIRLRRPIRVGPLRTRCDAMRQPSPISTLAPTIVHGSMDTSAPITAVESTIARGSIIAAPSNQCPCWNAALHFLFDADHFRFTREVAFDERVAGELHHVALVRDDLRLHVQPIARHD